MIEKPSMGMRLVEGIIGEQLMTSDHALSLFEPAIPADERLIVPCGGEITNNSAAARTPTRTAAMLAVEIQLIIIRRGTAKIWCLLLQLRKLWFME